MQKQAFVYWEEDGFYIGYFHEYPDYWTQGTTLDDLEEHLIDLRHGLEQEETERTEI